HVLGTVSTTLSVIADLVVILFVGFYFAIDPGLYRRGILLLIPDKGQKRAEEVLDRLQQKLRRWLIGKLALMLFVGVATALGLWAMHMPLIAILAGLAALLDFIPNIGPIISAVPAMLLALTHSPADALWVAVLYLVVQVVESYILQPLVQQRAVSLPPSLTLCAQVLAGTLLGMFGLIIATPLTVALMNLVQALYVEDYLGKKGNP
ncbi:MAG: AI-2E family transporter, partial [Acidobacteriota bacterium]|nr:AI-2E family transporter [Acidobacteriota bacterium]